MPEKGEKKLRKGYTTGTCAAAAAGMAMSVFFDDSFSCDDFYSILTPNGETVNVPVVKINKGSDWVECAVRKDSGDDPDVTNGVLVYAKVEIQKAKSNLIEIKGGTGIGVVTKPGLACKVGEPAINPVPLKMIENEIRTKLEEYDCELGVIATISIPAGVELAKKTFNKKLGIEGGLSVLGTTGIVEPMSEQAVIETMKVEINVKIAEGYDSLIITPGNYGKRFISDSYENLDNAVIKCSNYIGDILEHCSNVEVLHVLLVGHIGKLVKLATGAMNTHSKYGDGRIETIIAHVKKSGASEETLAKLKTTVTTEDALSVIIEQGESLKEKTINSLLDSIKREIELHVNSNMPIEVIMYSNVYGYLGETVGAKETLEIIKGEYVN